MKIFYRILVLVVSFAFLAGWANAQSDMAPELKDQLLEEELSIDGKTAALVKEKNKEKLPERDPSLSTVLLKTEGSSTMNTKNGESIFSGSGLCIDGLYTSGCIVGDGLIYWDLEDVNIPLIECDGTPETWYHDFTDQVHLLIPGNDYTLTVQGGYGGEYLDVWIDYNNDLFCDEDELVLNDAEVPDQGVNTEFTISIPSDAAGGPHVMRARTNWLSGVTGSCDTHNYGNCLDFSVQIGDEDFGNISGNVLLDGPLPYNIGDVTEVIVTAGSFWANPDASGNYDIEAYPGTYDVVATLYGYETQITADVTVIPNETETIDITMPCILGLFEGTVTALNGGAPIEGASVTAMGTGLSTTTSSDGSFSLLIEQGNYDFKVSAPFYTTQIVNLDITGLTTLTQDFQLNDSEGVIVVIELDPTPNPGIVDVIQALFPGGVVEYTTSVDGYPLDETVQTVFLLLGIYSNEYNLTEEEALVITTWIDAYGGNVYMEGGDTWAFDTQTSLHAYFNIEGLTDGTGDLANVDGIASYWSGFSWTYQGENNWIDHIEAIPPAINVMENPDVGYYCGVAHDAGTYKTVGASFEITGLVDGTGTYTMGVAAVMGYFGYPVFTYGNLEGFVTELTSGDPVEGAYVDVGGLADGFTDETGYYFVEEIISGDWDVAVSKENYQPQTIQVTIVEETTVSQDFQIVAPGSLEGTVTELGSGDPVEDVLINVGGGMYMATTDADGYYFIEEILTGSYNVTCTKEGYNPESVTLDILESVMVTQDFMLGSPEFGIDLSSISITLDPNATGTEYLTLSNTGTGMVAWSASLDVQGDGGEDMFDVIMDVPVGIGGGEAGIETDGSYIYTTMWNGVGEFQRYSMDGTWLETISVSGSAGCRDLAFDGTYFYGSAATTTIFEMDLGNEILISTFNAPTECRAIAYNETDDAFYCNNWNTDIIKFDKTGANLGSFPVSVYYYYGLAYDNYSGGEFLWGYAQTGNTLNELVQLELPTGAETGLTFDVGSVTNVGLEGIAGGLAIDDHIQAGLWAFLGTAQNANIWALELTVAQTWISIDPNSGTIDPGGSETMNVYFDATGLLPGYYYADINFSTNPDAGPASVAVELQVDGLIPAINLAALYSCTDVELSWEMPPGGDPDTWNVYRDSVFIGSADDMMYTDTMVDPEVEYSYTVTAVYGAEESFPTPAVLHTVPMPDDLEPLNADATHISAGDILITWEAPEACLTPDEYNVYRENEYLATTTELEYTDVGQAIGFYQYYVTAVYYFGESEGSLPAYVLVGIEDATASLFQLYPNPATDMINIHSDYIVESFELLNNSGQVVYQDEVNSGNFSIDVSRYERGIYYVKLKTIDRVILQKVAIN
jgi:hypothetical protein